MAILRAEGVTKRYGGTVALQAVDFAVHAGAVNVLIGENGAGKSTLMRILAGIEKPSEGALVLDGEIVEFSSVRQAVAHGIGIVHQELNLCPNLTVAENIFLTHTPGASGPLLDKAAEQREAQALLKRLEQTIDPDMPVAALRIGQQQVVEIAKALAEKCRVLILDEPTSALSKTEVEVLFRILGELKQEGVAIIYISHRLEELLRVGDRITVLRDGRVVESAEAAGVSQQWIIERMLGPTGHICRSQKSASRGAPVLTVEGVRTDRSGSHVPIEDVSATFHGGEITAIYGLLGAGRTELFEVICGVRKPSAGTVILDDRPLDGLSIADRVGRGVVLVPEDRQREGLFANLSVGGNISLADLSQFARAGVISVKQESAAVAGMIEALGVNTASAATPISALSGGNQQKVVIGRALMLGPSAILLDEPSRGVDVGARAEVFATMQRLASQGLAVIFSTLDVVEATTIADRILVMSDGRVTLDARADQVDEAMLIGAASASTAKPHAMVN